jgi:hypothetical protein
MTSEDTNCDENDSCLRLSAAWAIFSKVLLFLPTANCAIFASLRTASIAAWARTQTLCAAHSE